MFSLLDDLQSKIGIFLLTLTLVLTVVQLFATEHEQRNLSFYNYVYHSDDPYIKLTNYQIFEEYGKEHKQLNDLEHLQTWKNKLLHGPFIWEISEQICITQITVVITVPFCNITKEMEGLAFGAQKQDLFVNPINAYIYKILCSAKCWLYGSSDETVDHLVSCCSLFSTERINASIPSGWLCCNELRISNNGKIPTDIVFANLCRKVFSQRVLYREPYLFC